ncbi:hypothetical protein ACGFYA_18015 [Streptomyces sp. NPDC048305]|uniref:hypothetical protein n=1 Tax=Streptomyces sp. NPDC048305 TaxID=3365532 RepID=UPI0037157503
MSYGVLPTVDKQICSFERWLIGYLADIPDPDHAQVIRRFAIWEVLPRLRTSSHIGHSNDRHFSASAIRRPQCPNRSKTRPDRPGQGNTASPTEPEPPMPLSTNY